MGTWRVIRTYVRGPYENDVCFLQWIGVNVATIAIAEVVPIPAIQELAVPYKDTFATLYPFLNPNDFGSMQPTSNDQKLYVVYQANDTPTPNCTRGNPSLVTSGGLSAWPTREQAAAVARGDLAQRDKIAAQVKAANEAAVNPGKILGDAAKELADDAGKAATGVSPVLIGVGVLLGGLALWKVFK